MNVILNQDFHGTGRKGIWKFIFLDTEFTKIHKKLFLHKKFTSNVGTILKKSFKNLGTHLSCSRMFGLFRNNPE